MEAHKRRTLLQCQAHKKTFQKIEKMMKCLVFHFRNPLVALRLSQPTKNSLPLDGPRHWIQKVAAIITLRLIEPRLYGITHLPLVVRARIQRRQVRLHRVVSRYKHLLFLIVHNDNDDTGTKNKRAETFLCILLSRSGSRRRSNSAPASSRIFFFRLPLSLSSFRSHDSSSMTQSRYFL